MPQKMLPLFPAESTSINSLLGYSKKGDTIYYFNGQMPIFSHHESDHNAFRLIISQLVVNGVASQSEIVRAFGVSKISVKRSVKLYREEGTTGFFKKRQVRSSNVLTREVLFQVQERLNEGRQLKEIGEAMDLKVDTLKKALRDGRLYRVEKKTMFRVSPKL
jgi:transposase